MEREELEGLARLVADVNGRIEPARATAVPPDVAGQYRAMPTFALQCILAGFREDLWRADGADDHLRTYCRTRIVFLTELLAERRR